MRSNSGTSRRILGASRLVAVEDGVDLRVGHALRGADDAFRRFRSSTISPCWSSCMMQLSTRRSSAGRRLQMSGRELLRQHGNGAVGKVDGGAAQARFEVESA